MREFFAGLVSGLAFIGMGHPFDTIKTRLQSPSGIHYRGLTDCAFKIFQREGVLAFYRGVVPVLVSKPYIHAASFTLVHTYQSFFDGLLDGNATSQQKGKKCDLSRVAVSGALTGATLSIFVTPTELLKIRLQSRPDKVSLRTIVGFFSGGEFRVSHLLQGIRPTIARNAVGWGSFFWCSEYMKQMFRSFESHKSGPAETRDPPSEIHLGKVQLLISGGIAGGISTLLSLPADVIKTRLQAQSFQNREYSGMVDCARKSFKAEGFQVFYKGAQAAIIRNFIASAAVLVVYDWALGFYESCQASQKAALVLPNRETFPSSSSLFLFSAAGQSGEQCADSCGDVSGSAS